jgi:hypothetical protein
LQRDGDGLAYDEAVSFRTDGKLIRATLAEGAIVATFGDGSPFFSTRLDANGAGSASHRCGDDLYELTLTLRVPNVWTTVWDVSGTKSLRITTRYEPAAPFVLKAKA